MRNVLVTGGTRGVGLAITRKLAEAGYCVIALARSESQEFSAVRQELAGSEVGAVHFRRYDLADITGLRNLVKALRREFGPIYALVNNAALGASGLLATMHDMRIEELVRLNILSPLILTKYVVRAMMADGDGGRVVNITSIVGFTGFKGLSAYSATKASLTGFTRSLAREVGSLGVTVNAVAPGFLDTEMTRELTGERREQVARRGALGRLAGVDDVANAVEFLIGDKARNITGTVVTVDAGATA